MPIFTTLGAACAKAWGFTSGLITDQYFNLVSLLLPGNGTNGANNNEFLDSGTANSGSGFTITRNGNTTQGTFSPFSQTGWGAYFDGSNDYLSTANTASVQFGTGDFTIEHWLYTTALGTSRWIYDCRASAAAGPYFFCISSAGAYIFHDGTDRIGSTGKAQLNTWQHVAVVRASGTLSIYVNGVLDASFSVGTSLNPTGSFKIGADVSLAASSFYSGYISNFRIVKGVAVYTGNFTPPIVPLAATQSAGTNISAITGTQTTLLTCQSNRFVDNSSTPLTITPNNGVAITPFSPFAPTQSYSAAAVGGSGYFDGTGDYLTVPASTAFSFGTSPFTIETWVYLDTVNNNGSIALNGSYGLGANSDWILRVGSSGAATGKWEFTTFFGGTAYQVISNSAVVAKTWTHIAAVRNGNTFTLYIDGVAQTTTATNTNSVGFSNQTTLIVGDNTSGVLLKGWFSNFRIVNGTAVYTGNFTPPTGQLTTSGAASAASYPSTTNVNTSFASSATSLLLNFTNAGITDATAKNDLETVGNAQISTTQSKWGGGSVYFDGLNSYLLGASSQQYEFGSGDFTIEAWLNISAAPGDGGIITKGLTGTIDTKIWSLEFVGSGTYPNAVGWYVNAASASFIITGTTNLKSSTWTHVAVCKSGNNTRLFVNGQQEGSTYTTNYTIASGGSLYVGTSFYAPTTRDITGYIDDLRITKFARYTANFPAPTAPFPLQ